MQAKGRGARAALRSLDHGLLRLLRTHGHAPAAEWAVLRLARAGESGLLWHGLAAAGALLDGERRHVYLRAMRVVLIALVVNAAVKRLVRRTRPALEEMPALIVVSGRSYPSAHSATSFAGARALSGALPAGPTYALAVAMALTRPYLGVHYPSDIVAGAILGDAVAELVP
jgi:membrane-associated phospholipid phosphatase